MKIKKINESQKPQLKRIRLHIENMHSYLAIIEDTLCDDKIYPVSSSVIVKSFEGTCSISEKQARNWIENNYPDIDSRFVQANGIT